MFSHSTRVFTEHRNIKHRASFAFIQKENKRLQRKVKLQGGVVGNMEFSPNVGEFSLNSVNSPQSEKWVFTEGKNRIMKNRFKKTDLCRGLAKK